VIEVMELMADTAQVRKKDKFPNEILARGMALRCDISSAIGRIVADAVRAELAIPNNKDRISASTFAVEMLEGICVMIAAFLIAGQAKEGDAAVLMEEAISYIANALRRSHQTLAIEIPAIIENLPKESL
jgi:hypothetical protein